MRLEYLSYQECYNKPPLENDTAACDHYYSRAIQYPYGLLLTDCEYVYTQSFIFDVICVYHLQTDYTLHYAELLLLLELVKFHFLCYDGDDEVSSKMLNNLTKIKYFFLL